MAELVAKKSKDPSTQIGAVIVGPDNEIRSTGYNGMPRGCDDDVDGRYERPEKYYWFEHAERNAIYNAARMGTSINECTMYLNCGIPCMDCARGIANSGIVRIFAKRTDITKDGRWAEHSKRSLELFNELGVDVRYYDDQ